MKRREFLQSSLLGVATVRFESLSAAPAWAPPLAANATAGFTRLCDVVANERTWEVWEDLRTADGALVFSSAAGSVWLSQRVEAVAAGAAEP